jgi:membrane protein implicated in regulation of membrane protease activity
VTFFTFLNGISPWWWVAFGVGLGALEMVTMSFFLIWPAIAGLIGAGLLWLSPELSGEWQVVTFAVLSVILTFIGRSLIHKFGDGGAENNSLNARSTLMIGRQAEVIDFVGPEGNVTIDGIRWHAVWPQDQSSAPGSMVEIARADGMTLFVKTTDNL